MRTKQIALLSIAFTYLLIFGFWMNKLSFKREIDPYLARYYLAFEQAASNNCFMREYEAPNQIILRLGSLKDDDIGQCAYNSFHYTITIDTFAWDALDEAGRYQLMFHEASHCLFHEDHVDDPTNIMNPSIYELPIFTVFYQAEQIIKKNCTLWREHGFRPIEIRN